MSSLSFLSLLLLVILATFLFNHLLLLYLRILTLTLILLLPCAHRSLYSQARPNQQTMARMDSASFDPLRAGGRTTASAPPAPTANWAMGGSFGSEPPPASPYQTFSPSPQHPMMPANDGFPQQEGGFAQQQQQPFGGHAGPFGMPQSPDPFPTNTPPGRFGADLFAAPSAGVDPFAPPGAGADPFAQQAGPFGSPAADPFGGVFDSNRGNGGGGGGGGGGREPGFGSPTDDSFFMVEEENARRKSSTILAVSAAAAVAQHEAAGDGAAAQSTDTDSEDDRGGYEAQGAAPARRASRTSESSAGSNVSQRRGSYEPRDKRGNVIESGPDVSDADVAATMEGEVLARLSARSMLTKDWKQIFWVMQVTK